MKLAAECGEARQQAGQRSLAFTARSSGDGKDRAPPGIGIDPAFSQQSTMYDPQVCAAEQKKHDKLPACTFV